jgi:nucleotide-binding universal stress UspA family protein
MTFRTFLLHLPAADRARGLLDAALPLIQASEGHVIGLHVSPPFMLRLGQVFTADLEGVAREERRRSEEVERIKSIFSERTAPLPLVTEWRHVDAADEPGVARAVIGMARAADLVIASLAGPDDHPSLRPLPARLALECGRPVLLIPPSWSKPIDASTVVVAWNGSREAARAAFDALPLLQAATRVEIVTTGRDEDTQPLPLAGEEIAAALARHGVKCEVAVLVARGESDGASLLARVKEVNAGLLVMGAYGRPRFSELVLGGVTQHVLAASPVPVLLSH